MFEFVLFLATHYNWKWAATSFPTVKVFLDVYELLHPHLSYPSPFCSPGDPEAHYVAQLATIALCYVELYLDNMHRRTSLFSSKACAASTPTTSKCFQECLIFVQLCSSGLLGNERRNFELRGDLV